MTAEPMAGAPAAPFLPLRLSLFYIAFFLFIVIVVLRLVREAAAIARP